MKVMDKLKNMVKFDKKIILFLSIITLIGILAGSIFVTILNEEDILLINSHLNDFINNIENNTIDYLLVLKNNLFTNVFYVIVLWLLGISIIGLPLILLIYFSKTFILGFSVGSIIATYKLKGIIFAFFYVFPGQIISLLSFFVLTIYAMSFSVKLIYSVLKKKTINFKLIMNKYLIILVLILIIVLLMNLYDTYIMPSIIKLFIHFIR